LVAVAGLTRATNAGSRPSSGRPPRPPSAVTRRILEELAQESLEIVEDIEGNTSVRGLTYIEVRNQAEAATLLAGGTSLRATAATEQNDVSSRSHTVFTISVINYGCNAATKAEIGARSGKHRYLSHLIRPGTDNLTDTYSTLWIVLCPVSHSIYPKFECRGSCGCTVLQLRTCK
jgi:hypothetical protein